MTSDTMHGVYYRGDRQADVREYPIPTPRRGEALVQVKAAAVCGSDLHRYRVAGSLIQGKEPWVPGHEPAGVVAALGEDCTQRKVGDRVTVFHWLGCGHCKHCRAGMMQWCEQHQAIGHPQAWGGDADYLVVPERNCLPLPDRLSYEDGAIMACIGGTTYAALRKLAPNGDDTVAIFGQGPVGLSGLIMAKALGARVIGIDLSDERLALATALGADYAVRPDANGPAAAVLAATVAALTHGEGADAALETSGSGAAHRGVIEVLRRGGRAVFVGFGANEPTVNLCHIIGKQLTLMGSHVMPIHYYWDLVDFYLAHDLHAQYARLITHRFPITAAAEAFRVADSATAGKVMFVWE
ncbi:MAG: alcohol dehydrogenase catalytic domain-containing protein [Chloroflexota bacterium]